jgi:hypothetical protein
MCDTHNDDDDDEDDISAKLTTIKSFFFFLSFMCVCVYVCMFMDILLRVRVGQSLEMLFYKGILTNF